MIYVVEPIGKICLTRRSIDQVHVKIGLCNATNAALTI